MRERRSIPIHLYVLPIGVFVLAGFLSVWMDRDWIMWATIGVGIVQILHVFLVDVINAVESLWREINYTLEHVSHMDENEKFQFGLAKLPTDIGVTIDKTAAVGNQLSKSSRRAPIEPFKMKIIAQAVLQGRPFSIREWTPISKGKLLSDPDYRALEAYLIQPDPELPDLHFIEQRSPADVRQGYMWTDAGIQFLHQCIDQPVIG